MKYLSIALCALITVCFFLGSREASAVPNPAAAYATKLGYDYQIVKAPDGEREVVTVAPGIEFDAWDFYRGKTGSDYSYGAQFGYDTICVTEKQGSFVAEYAVCISRDKRAAGGTIDQETQIPLLDLMEQNGEPLFDEDVHRLPPEFIQQIDGTEDSVLPPLKSLPSEWDWRDYNGSNYIGSVRNQGNCGSCYAFGACASAEGTYNYAQGLTGNDCIDFSESYVIWCLGSLPAYYNDFYGCDGASYEYMELEALVEDGVTTEAYYPYTTTEPASCTHWTDPVTQLDSWHRVTSGDITAIKTAIMTYGVVDAAVWVGSAFDGYDSGIYDDSNNTCDSGYYTDSNHAIALVGWDDSPPEGGGGVWILRNSWGSSWGESGYMRLRYDAAVVHCAVCYMTYGPPPPTPPTLDSIGNRSVAVSNTLLFAVTATPTDGDAVTLSVSNAPAGTYFSSTAENGTFSWTNAQPVGVYTMTFYAVDDDGFDSETITINVHDGSVASGLFISEYVEGSSNEKYIEIFNGTGISVDLADYALLLYANGSTAHTVSNTLSGTLADSDVIVYRNSAATNSGFTVNSACNFNGDDAVALWNCSASSYADIFGRIGEDPGSAWIDGSYSTVNQTLVRKSTVMGGVTSNPGSGFPTLSTEWDYYAQDNEDDLDSHTFDGGAPTPPEIVITNPASESVSVGTGTSTYDIQGTCNAEVDGEMTWTNSLTGSNGTLSAATSWTISSVYLAYGTNVIAVSGTNDTGTAAGDTVAITRPSPPPPEAPTIEFSPSGTNQTATVSSLLTVTVTATEPNGDTISLFHDGIPSGASFAGATSSSPASCDFTWTPGSAGTFTADFIAEDPDGATTQTIQIVVSEADSGGVETFANFAETGSSYVDGNFTGQDGSTWTYLQCRGDIAITNETPCMGRNRVPLAEIESGTIAGGCGTLSFNLMQAFSTPYDVLVYVNDELVDEIIGGTEGVIDHSGSITVNEAGNFVIRIVQGSSSAGQVCIDNIEWTGYGGSVSDEDSDGIPDDWELQWSTSATGLTATADDDGDGADNFSEFVADTCPTSDLACFRCVGSRDGTGYALSFPGSTSRLYTLFLKTNIMDDSGWVPIYTDLTGTNTSMTLGDTNAGAILYYRLEVELP